MRNPTAPTVPKQLRVERLVFGDDEITIRASASGRSASCPVCGRRSARVHGTYERSLADLPWGGVPVRP